MLYLTKEDMHKLCSMRDAFETLRDAFTLYSSGKSTVPLRSMIDVPHHRGQAIFMPALAGDALGIKIVSTYPDNPVRGKPVTPACMLVMDASTGEACCLMDGTYLTQLRTAAGAGLATEVLAAPGAHVGALIGLGGRRPASLTPCWMRRPPCARCGYLIWTRAGAPPLPRRGTAWAECMSLRHKAQTRRYAGQTS